MLDNESDVHFTPSFFLSADSILVTEHGSSSVPFNSISKVASTSGFKGLYKLFSKEPVPETWLSMLFDGGYEIAAQQVWMGAYPAFDPPENFPPFQLNSGLYYANAWENSASAMEMAALGGRNVALLAAQYLSSTKRQVPVYSEDTSTLEKNRVEVELLKGVYKSDGAGAAAAA